MDTLNSNDLQEATVDMDGLGGGPWDAYVIPGQEWNGWAVPYFTKEQADRLIATIDLIDPGAEMRYDAERDAYIFTGDPEVMDPEPEVFEGFEVQGHKVYSIGGMSWCWWNVTEDVEQEDATPAYEVSLRVAFAGSTKELEAALDEALAHARALEAEVGPDNTLHVFAKADVVFTDTVEE